MINTTLLLATLLAPIDLNGIWDFHFEENAALECVAKPSFAATDKMPVPGCFDTMPKWFLKRGTGLYRRSFNIPQAVSNAWLVVEGLGLRGDFHLDGRSLGCFPYPYSHIEIPTGPLAAGEHVLFAALDNRFDWQKTKLARPYYDFYFYGGFYHGVRLIFDNRRLLVRTRDYKRGEIEIEAVNFPRKDFETTLTFDGTNRVASTFRDGRSLVRVPAPRLWSPEGPNLHSVSVDGVSTRFGIREIIARKGALYLNGKRIFLKGVNRHEAHIEFGAATSRVQMTRDLQILKNLGANFVRGAHYPQSQAFLDLCDEVGMLVWEESLGWGNGQDYTKMGNDDELNDAAFIHLQKEQTRNMVRASFNHPSVIVFGFLNECCSTRKDCKTLVDSLIATIRNEDSGRLVTFACNTWQDDICNENTDIISVNAYPGTIPNTPGTPEQLHAQVTDGPCGFNTIIRTMRTRYPEKPIVISESGVGAEYGARDPACSFYTEAFQDRYLHEILTTLWSNRDVSGFAVWQFSDTRTYKPEQDWLYGKHFGCSFAGIVNHQRLPKTSFSTVQRFFTKETPAALKPQTNEVFDLVIYGSTPAAISAGVQAKRMGVTCVVVSPETRIGGLTTGGLGATDIGNKSAFGGISLAFYRAVAEHYHAKGSMWTFEPSAALQILEGWEKREGLDIRRGEYLNRDSGKVKVEGKGDQRKIVSFETLSGKVYAGKHFIDATYEGDLMAAAGVSYIVGREANSVYGETISGMQRALAVNHQMCKRVSAYVKPGDPTSGLLPGVLPEPPEKDGEGDTRVQAYCFRMCLTDNPTNRIPFKKPTGYDERVYEILFRNFEAGGSGMPWINSRMPNRKTDTNNRTGVSTDYIGHSAAWAEASYAEREKILKEHLLWQQGLMWSLANHPRVPEGVRKEVSRWGTCKDEFTDGFGDGWQRQLYVREARRMVGAYVVTEHDVLQHRVTERPIAMAAYGMDSHNCLRYCDKNGYVRNEGNIEDYRAGCKPYPIDMGAIMPKRGECGNLLVPVCLSASHMAFGSIRMEPVFFALGQAAGTLAALALKSGTIVQDVSYPVLRRRLLADGQALPDAPPSTSLNGAWQFRKQGDTAWRTVEVPHDWAIEGPFDPNGEERTGKLPWRGAAEYRRAFDAAATDAGECAFLVFDGVMSSPKVKVNGVDVGGWDYGYLGFRVEITKQLRDGSNSVEVAVDTRDHGSRWYPGAGIYRDVRFVTYRPKDVDPDTLFIRCDALATNQASLVATFRTFEGKESTHRWKVTKPVLWDVENPHLYTLELRGQKFRYGIRTITMSPEGLSLNGRHVPLRGVCLHSDLGPLGMAFNRSAAQRQLRILKDMGVNAIRTSHNPPAPQFLDLCDEMGFLVWDECFDKWQSTAGRRDDQNLEDYISRNLAAFVRRDRNHPCVFCYSAGNEISPANVKTFSQYGGGDPNGTTPERNALFARVMKGEDPTRLTAMGCSWTNAVPYGNYDAFDVTGWNYDQLYRPMHEHAPEKPLVYSESASALSGYGEYAFAAPVKPLAFPNRPLFTFDWGTHEVDSYDSLAAPWSDIPDVEFARMERDRYVAGEFVWTGFDYLGEPTPWSRPMFSGALTNMHVTAAQMARSSYFGIVDLCGIPKDRYYLYRSHWNKKKETTHIVPQHWNLKDGCRVPVSVYTSGDEAELFLNGRTLGRRKKGTGQVRAGAFADAYYAVCDTYRLMWFDVPFERGELKAVSYRGGKKLGEDVVRTCGERVGLRLTPEEKTLPADGESVVYVQVDITDARGTRDPEASDRVTFAIEGPAKILAVGNGNACGLDSFSDTSSHPLYKGRAIAILRREKGTCAPVTLSAAAQGLRPARVTLPLP